MTNITAKVVTKEATENKKKTYKSTNYLSSKFL